MSGLGANVGPCSFKPVACRAQPLPPRILTQHLDAPAKSGAEAQRAVVIKPAVVEIGGRHVRSDALQASRLFRCGEQLRRALVGEAVHADAAIACGMLAEPRDGFRTVAAFIAKGIELALEPPRPRTS